MFLFISQYFQILMLKNFEGTDNRYTYIVRTLTELLHSYMTPLVWSFSGMCALLQILLQIFDCIPSVSKELGLKKMKGIAFKILLSLLINSDNIRDLIPNSFSKNLSPISQYRGLYSSVVFKIGRTNCLLCIWRIFFGNNFVGK